MSLNIPSLAPNQISETLRAMTDRGFKSPLNIGLVAAISLLALYKTLPALSPGTTRPKVYPSFETLVLTGDSRRAKLKQRVDDIYPRDIFGPGADHSVDLPKGRVTYWLIGPQEGKRVILIHGVSMPSLVWELVAKRLATAGFRVLIYDLYGRGYSEAPDALSTLYNTELYITQLALLMQAVGWRKARIVGLSMGGGIAAAFAARFPWLVESSVTLIAPTGIIEGPVGGLLARLFGSARYQRLRHSAVGKLFEVLPATPPPIASTLTESDQLFKKLSAIIGLQTVLLPGYSAAVASSIFGGPLKGLTEDFRKLGNLKDVKVLLIWGKKDKVVPYEYSRKVNKLIPHAKLVTIDNGGHDVTVSHSDRVIKELEGFLPK